MEKYHDRSFSDILSGLCEIYLYDSDIIESDRVSEAVGNSWSVNDVQPPNYRVFVDVPTMQIMFLIKAMRTN
jgi:hypothetical protein